MTGDYIPAGERQPKPSDDPVWRLVVIVYLLQALAIPTSSLTALAGVIINYLKIGEARNSWLEAHFRWQIRTFWLGLLWLVIGTVTTFIIVGWFILLGAAIWFIYRVVRGALALNDGRAP
ncbi:Uncharacterized membrane protein [Marinobacter daqiaonensis]|uniref:Uncharacterized membrane protein n=1 Tax=Marinobacter daqiaonensis TaxID=650891 RepID=A0A1I6HF49_9GAMM|nr:hypothetical protein [Marinobacter daqiaonensis]SFR53008.1 Uncharacterized membrane protein [Marinobacter daqiaonensis]